MHDLNTAQPFTIGLKPFDASSWIEPDDLFDAYLDEKDRLLDERFGDVFVEEPESRAAQAEVLDMLSRFLPARFPAIWSATGSGMQIAGTGAPRYIKLDNPDCPPLLAAARLVQEDLVIMTRGPDGWRLSAACVCFPSSWTLREKFTRPLQDIHATVPGFGPGARMADVITRIFDNLKPGLPAERWNWSVHGDDQLYHPHSARSLKGRSTDPAAAFIRMERQTLTRLPATGSILFTIRIFIDPLAALARQGNGPAIAANLASQIEALDEDQLTYKGLVQLRAPLLARLRALSRAPV